MNTLVKSLVAAAAFCSMSAHAGVILQNQSGAGGYQANYYEPIGQSFMAEDASIAFAFSYVPMNPGFSVSNLRVRLVAGDGVGGAQLASTTFMLPSGYTGFHNVDFSSVALTVGSMYTALLDIPGNSPYWGVTLANNNPYANGRAYFSGAASSFDMTFRVTPVVKPAEVPEPATIAMLSLGLAGLAVARRKKA